MNAGGTLFLATTGSLTQTAVGEISGKSLAIHTADIENRGLMQADEGAAITASNLKNNATGRIYGNTIHVQASHIQNEKNADLKGAVIASEADAGKNRLSTRKFSFSDLKNEASMPSNTIVTDIKDTMTGKRPTTMGDTINTMQKKTLM